MIEILVSFIFVILLLASLVVTWVNFGRIKGIEGELKKLKERFDKSGLAQPSRAAQTQTVTQEPIRTQTPLPSPSAVPLETPKLQPQPLIAKVTAQPTAQALKPKQPAVSFEQRFGSIVVWVGGVALAVGGVFLVKASIDAGLLGPEVRVLLGILLGLGFLLGAHFIHRRPTLANGKHIAHALSGSGISVLYASIFAATTLYGFVGPLLGFLGMALVTALAVFLSLRDGIPIALLGLVGGFLTPALIHSGYPSAPGLFGYLALVTGALLLLVRKQNWWWLSFLSLFGAYLWVCLWLVGGFFALGDAVWLGLFLIIVTGGVVAASKDQLELKNTASNLPRLLNYTGVGGSLFLMGIVAGAGKFELSAWGLFALLSMGCIALAYSKQKIYGFAPFVSMLVAAGMLASWNVFSAAIFAGVLVFFAALHVVSAYLMQLRAERAVAWSSLVGVTGILYFTLGYFKLRHADLLPDVYYFWGAVAILLAALAALAFQNIRKSISDERADKQLLLAVYAATSTAFLSFGLGIEISVKFWSIALACQIGALALISTKIHVKFLRHIAAGLAAAFVLVVSQDFVLLYNYSMDSLVGDVRNNLFLGLSAFYSPSPLIQLGIPAVMLALASLLFRKRGGADDVIVKSFEVGATAIFGVMIYFLVRQAFFVNDLLPQATAFIEGSLFSNLILIYATVCFYLGKKFARPMVTLGATVLMGFALFRVGYFQVLLNNPLWSHQIVGSIPVFNALMLAFGFPIAWLFMAMPQKLLGTLELRRYAHACAFALAFVWVSLIVRQFFQGTFLDSSSYSDAEIYTYSAVWLLFGVALLVLGTYRNDVAIRIASMVITMLAVAKVFLYDARELEGLLRVVSFFGLGLSLLALSWFYTRFVFAKNKKQPE